MIGAEAVVPGALLRVIELAGEAAPPVEGAEAAGVLVGQGAGEGVSVVPFPAALVAAVRHRARRVQMIGIDVIVGAAHHHAHGRIAQEHRLFRHAAGQTIAAQMPPVRLIGKDHMARRAALPGLAHPLAEIVHPIIRRDAAAGGAGQPVAPVIGIGDAAYAGDVPRRVIGRGIRHRSAGLAGEFVAGGGEGQRGQRLPRHAEGAPVAVGIVGIGFGDAPSARPARQPIVSVIAEALVQRGVRIRIGRNPSCIIICQSAGSTRGQRVTQQSPILIIRPRIGRAIAPCPALHPTEGLIGDAGYIAHAVDAEVRYPPVRIIAVGHDAPGRVGARRQLAKAVITITGRERGRSRRCLHLLCYPAQRVIAPARRPRHITENTQMAFGVSAGVVSISRVRHAGRRVACCTG